MSAPNVLIVEDNVAQAESLFLILRDRGIQAYLAPDGRAAVQKVKTHPPDAVVLDLILPDGGAMGFLHWLRQESGLPEMPVVVITGLTSVEPDLKEAVKYRNVNVLQKPYEVDNLIRCLGLDKLAPGQTKIGETNAGTP
jgi:DNA-binding response OmpR family regulator